MFNAKLSHLMHPLCSLRSSNRPRSSPCIRPGIVWYATHHLPIPSPCFKLLTHPIASIPWSEAKQCLLQHSLLTPLPRPRSPPCLACLLTQEQTVCNAKLWPPTHPLPSLRFTDIGLYRILPLSILYGLWHTKGGLGGDRVLRNRAIVLQWCGQCRWGGARKGGSSRAEQLWRKRISCEGQLPTQPASSRSLSKILFCFWASVHESILFFAHPPFV